MADGEQEREARSAALADITAERICRAILAGTPLIGDLFELPFAVRDDRKLLDVEQAVTRLAGRLAEIAPTKAEIQDRFYRRMSEVQTLVRELSGLSPQRFAEAEDAILKALGRAMTAKAVGAGDRIDPAADLRKVLDCIVQADRDCRAALATLRDIDRLWPEHVLRTRDVQAFLRIVTALRNEVRSPQEKRRLLCIDTGVAALYLERSFPPFEAIDHSLSSYVLDSAHPDLGLLSWQSFELGRYLRGRTHRLVARAMNGTSGRDDLLDFKLISETIPVLHKLSKQTPALEDTPERAVVHLIAHKLHAMREARRHAMYGTVEPEYSEVNLEFVLRDAETLAALSLHNATPDAAYASFVTTDRSLLAFADDALTVPVQHIYAAAWHIFKSQAPGEAQEFERWIESADLSDWDAERPSRAGALSHAIRAFLQRLAPLHHAVADNLVRRRARSSEILLEWSGRLEDGSSLFETVVRMVSAAAGPWDRSLAEQGNPRFQPPAGPLRES